MVDPCGQRTTHADGASRRAGEQARDDERVEETQSFAEEAEEEKWRRKERRERQNKQCSENTLHIVLHSASTTNGSSNGRGDAASVATTGVLKLKDADDFGPAVQAAIYAGEGSSQILDFLLLDVTPFVNAFGDDWWCHDEAYRKTAR